MRRQEVLLNLTLLVIIGALIFFIYESREAPRGLDELEVTSATVELAEPRNGEGADTDDAASGETADNDEEADPGDEDAADGPADAPPGLETEYAPRLRRSPSPGSSAGEPEKDKDKPAREVAEAGSNRGGQFGTRNLFRALLTPTPTPTPSPTPPPPTPDIGKALGAWRLLSVYNGKAMIEDVQKSAAGAEGAIWEMPPGGTVQVDVGGGSVKTATLKEIDAENPYNPEVTFSLEGTDAEKKINLDTEPAAAAPKPAPKK